MSEPTTYHQSQTAQGEDVSFIRRYRNGLIQAGLWTAIIGLTYTILVSAVGIIHSLPAKYEQFNPRTRQETKQQQRQIFPGSIDRAVEVVGQKLSDATVYPLKAIGKVTWDRYLVVRNKAFEIAGVDENKPEDDTKRFALYRGLGFAISKSGKEDNAIYIPFSVWQEFVQNNSKFGIDGWDKWSELEHHVKSYATLLGKAFFKADSKLNNGNEDGVVDDREWKRALNKMGYVTVDDIVDEIIAKVKTSPQDPRDELKNLVGSIKTNTKYLVGMSPEKIPRKELEEYLFSK